MKKNIILTSSPEKTRRAGSMLAEELLKRKSGSFAKVVGLRGDLGGGKTTFLKGFARRLGVSRNILSPTFVIMRRYHAGGTGIEDFYHLDCYRVGPKEILNLGFKKIISCNRNVVAIEWADRIKRIMPKNTIWVDFEFISDRKRKITF